jgi:tungstate transport system substrate-binding protein
MNHGMWARARLGAAKALLAGAALALAGAAWSETITMASTTSTEQSGLFGYLLPAYKKATGVDIKVVAVGTGQAIDIARRGDADVLFVHDQVAEERFVAEGGSVKRYPVMYNDFVLIGPRSDPVGVHGSDVVAALRKIAAAQAPFVSRGDKSGTNAAELRYWKTAGVADKGRGYKECGCGMGSALNIASAANAYTLSDRGTWLNFRNRGDLAILVEGDKRMFNQYGVMVVNPTTFPQVKAKLAQQFVDWVTSPAGQTVIANYKIDGQQLFFPNANANAH